MMPGGSPEAYTHIQSIVEKVAAQVRLGAEGEEERGPGERRERGGELNRDTRETLDGQVGEGSAG